MLILNDIHIGVQRKGGTTPASQEALRTYLFSEVQAALDAATDPHALVLGDLFDDFEVSPRDWIETYAMFSAWLRAGSGRHLTLSAGNHDHSAKGDRVSSFQMLCRVLRDRFHDQLTLVMVDAWAEVAPGVYALAHCVNQDIFDLRLAEVAKQSPKVLLLHANYDNKFAAVSDHSLNVSEEQAAEFMKHGTALIFAHEHQARRFIWKTSACGITDTLFRLDAGVYVLGNQFSTSVSDCLGNDAKFAHILKGGQLTKVQTWSADGVNGYAQINWRDLAGHTGEQGFIRVAGEAKSSEAAEVINAIAKFRQRSKAFVISNAVAIDGIVSAESLPASFEAAKAFDVVNFVHRHLDDREKATFDSLLGQQA